jgi:hypothetical protein
MPVSCARKVPGRFGRAVFENFDVAVVPGHDHALGGRTRQSDGLIVGSAVLPAFVADDPKSEHLAIEFNGLFQIGNHDSRVGKCKNHQ